MFHKPGNGTTDHAETLSGSSGGLEDADFALIDTLEELLHELGLDGVWSWVGEGGEGRWRGEWGLVVFVFVTVVVVLIVM
jgi:hypothetical protein